MDTTSYVLTNLSPVVDLIFSYLSGKSLSNAGQVCTSWYCTMKREMKKRHWWDSGLLECSNYIEEIQINSKAQFHFDRLQFQPSLILAVKSSESESGGDEDFVWEVNHMLPKKCSVLSAHVGGVIGRKKGLKTKNVELEYKSAISYLCLRPSNDLQFKTFFISKKEIQKVKTNELNFFNMIGGANFSSEDDNVILLFATSSPKIKHLVDQIKKSTGNRKVIVVGGYTDNINDSSSTLDTTRGVMGVVFNGKKINAGLHIQYNNSTETLHEGLDDMKKRILNESKRDVDWGKSLMFFVSCVGRGEHYYDGIQNVESAIVDKVYPGINTFGFFGFGEIGLDSRNTISEYESCNYSLTSVFCLLNYG